MAVVRGCFFVVLFGEKIDDPFFSDVAIASMDRFLDGLFLPSWGESLSKVSQLLHLN